MVWLRHFIISVAVAIEAVLGVHRAAQLPIQPSSHAFTNAEVASTSSSVGALQSTTSTITAQQSGKVSATKDDSHFITSVPVDLSQMESISTFRSCSGHDYSGIDIQGGAETNRSMKHYFSPIPSLTGTVNVVKVYAPFDGTIRSIFSEQYPVGKQVWLKPDANTQWNFIYFHITLLSQYHAGSSFKAGDLIAYANLPGGPSSFDIGLQKLLDGNSLARMEDMLSAFSPSHGSQDEAAMRAKYMSGKGDMGMGEMEVDSIFNHMTKPVLDVFKKGGITPARVIADKAYRDAHTCHDYQFHPDDYVPVGNATVESLQGWGEQGRQNNALADQNSSRYSEHHASGNTCPGYPVAAPQTSASGAFTSAVTDINAIDHISSGNQTGDNRFTYLWIKNGQRVPVIAPADGTLIKISYKTRADLAPGLSSEPDYDLTFLVDCHTMYRINHITDPDPSIAALRRNAEPMQLGFNLPPPSEQETSPKQYMTVKAGQELGTTVGTPNAHNWDFGVFVDRQAVCPYNEFGDSLRSGWLNIFQGQPCEVSGSF